MCGFLLSLCKGEWDFFVSEETDKRTILPKELKASSLLTREVAPVIYHVLLPETYRDDFSPSESGLGQNNN